MNIIKHNPFRVLGLLGNSTERELQKQIGLIKAFARVGKTKSFDYDFEFIGDFTRNSDEIQQASNSIEQAHKKLLYSLFWFVKNNQFDEIAFNNLKENQTYKAIEIWNKTLKEEITSKNYSSYLNLSTLYIALSTIDNQVELQKLQAGISLKGNLIHSENLKDFSKLVTGNGVVNDPIEISKKFVDEIIELLKPYLNKENGISTNDLISLFNTFPKSIQKYISAKFTEIPISSIEDKIEKTVIKRKKSLRDAGAYGNEHYISTKDDLVLLRGILDKENMQLQMITNKLANEILQCSIDFFNEVREEEGPLDPRYIALLIAKNAKSVGPTGQVRNRVIEALDTLDNMTYKDCFQTIDILNAIIDVYKKLDEENSYAIHILFEKKIIDESKILAVLKPTLSNQIIEKIAKSNKSNLINDFNKLLNQIISRISYRNSEFFENKKEIFISYLPITNSIKYNFEKSKLDKDINALQGQLSDIKKKKMYSSELQRYQYQMAEIKEWKLFRSGETRENQIIEQQQKINNVISKGENEKKQEVSRIEEQLVIKRRELKNLTR